MAGVPPIPPLLCNTPPPIDFGDEDDDSGLPPTLALEDDDEFGDFTSLATDLNDVRANEDVSSLPRTPLQFELSSSSTTSGFTDVIPTYEECDIAATPISTPSVNGCTELKEDECKLQLNEAYNYDVTKSNYAENSHQQGIDENKSELFFDTTNDTEATKTNLRADAVEACTKEIAVDDNKESTHNSQNAKITNAVKIMYDQLPIGGEKAIPNTPTNQSKPEENACDATSGVQAVNGKLNISINNPVNPLATTSVLLEDLADDSSDEEYHSSPKKLQTKLSTSAATAGDINSDDFFAIHVVDEFAKPTSSLLTMQNDDYNGTETTIEVVNMNKSSNHNNNNISDQQETQMHTVECDNDADFGDFANFETACEYVKPADVGGSVTSNVETAAATVLSNESVKMVDEHLSKQSTLNQNDEDDFDDFQDFCAAPTTAPIISAPIISTQNVLQTNAYNTNLASKENVSDECQVEDSIASVKITKTDSEITPVVNDKADDDDDDDDFGDFEAASFDTPSSGFVATTTPSTCSQPSAINSVNLCARLGTVLQQMFPTTSDQVADGSDDSEMETKMHSKDIATTLPFESIEAAKALEFQWPQSEIRHALIRSIGIDSRNILFGDNWNPSMPRFAANLSFNPLKPMKTQIANNTSISSCGTTPVHTDATQCGSSSAADLSISSSYAGAKTDVPDVDFDWQGGGLMNPLEASNVDPLPLDLYEEVIQMNTNVNNLAVDYSPCSSAASTFSVCAMKMREQLMATTSAINKTTTKTKITSITTTTLTSSLTPPLLQTASLPLPIPRLIANNNSLIPPINVMPDLTPKFLTHQCTYRTHGNLSTYQNYNTIKNPNHIQIESLICLNNSTNHIPTAMASVADTYRNLCKSTNVNTNNNKNSNDGDNSSNDFTLSTQLNFVQTFLSNSYSNCAATRTMDTINSHLAYNRLLRDCSRLKSETSMREAETLHPSPPAARLDTSDEQHQSHTTVTNIGNDGISEKNLNNKNNDMHAPSSPLSVGCHTALPTDDMTTMQHAFSVTHISSNINNNNNNGDNNDNGKILRLGANIIMASDYPPATVDYNDDDEYDDDDYDDETVVTSTTYAGPLKETHIYTPSKTELAAAAKTNKTQTTTTSEPIDFDYEIAAAGIIIDEKVVKKEYRDVEYNPGFSLDVPNEYAEYGTPVGTPTISPGKEANRSMAPSASTSPSTATPNQTQTLPMAEFDTDGDEFTEFQSVPAATTPTMRPVASTQATYTPFGMKSDMLTRNKTVIPSNIVAPAVAKTKEIINTSSRTSSPSIIDNMILSPAILLPQAIPISGASQSSKTPAIEWGDSTAAIDPDELARIEELFPQPKLTPTHSNSTQQTKSSPTHAHAQKQQTQNAASISISAAVAQKEQDSTLSDDYWSEFVSVPARPPPQQQQLSSHVNRLNNNNGSMNTTNSNNNNNQLNIATKRVAVVQRQQQQQFNNVQRALTPTPLQKPSTTPCIKNGSSNTLSAYNNSSDSSNSNCNSNSNDDDWSDFVSSTPVPAQSAAPAPAPPSASFMAAAHAPQFNSAAWQNANFYNNPLGLYHQQANLRTTTTNIAPLTPQQQQLQLQQQIHVMQDFSTAPTIAVPHSQHAARNNSNNMHGKNIQHSNAQFNSNFNSNSTTHGVGSVGGARIAPSISLIPDLGFIAPALPVHTSFVNVLPKTSFNSNKK